MANTFSGDSNCYAVWNFESGALTTDSKSTNTLTNYQTVAEETGDYKQGSCCASFDGGSRQLYRADTDLSAGFPLKSGDTNKKISVVFWIYLLALPEASQSFYIVDKYGVAGNTRSLGISVYNNAGTYELRVRFGITSGTSSELWTAFSGLAIYTWYHIGITYDDAAKGYTGVLWDTTPTAHKHVLTAGNITNNISITTADWCISGIPDRNSSFANMRFDECVVFNDILSEAEIDAIRGGTYATPSATPSASPSASISASPSAEVVISGETCWGHLTDVTEANIRTFTDNWAGTGTIQNAGTGDAERIALDVGEYMISEVVGTGSIYIELLQNEYAAGDTVIMQYRHGPSIGDCESAAWNDYVGKFNSLGFAQIRIESTL